MLLKEERDGEIRDCAVGDDGDDNGSSRVHRKQVKRTAARHRERFPFQVNSASVGEQDSRDGRMLHLLEGVRSQFTVYPHFPPASSFLIIIFLVPLRLSTLRVS